MKHSFTGSGAKCIVCDYNYMAHTVAAICEACSNVASCEIYPAPKSKFAMLLCPTCFAKEEETNKAIVDNVSARTKVSMNEVNAIHSFEQVQKIVREEDSSIRFSGDIFNAEVTSINDIYKSAMNDESLGDKDQRFYAFQKLIAERIENYKNKIFNLDEEKHQEVAKQRAAIESLRQYGNSIRQEIRDRIKQADALYTPNPVIKPPKIEKPKISAFDRLVESFAIMQNISKEEAKKRLEASNIPMNGK